MIDRDHAGKYPAFTSHGGYPIVYIVADGGALCAACANGGHGSEATEDPEADKQWRMVGADVYWEGPPMQCDHCNEDTDSAYGDPDAEESEESL